MGRYENALRCGKHFGYLSVKKNQKTFIYWRVGLAKRRALREFGARYKIHLTGCGKTENFVIRTSI
jgi:hypothetical protein